MSNNALSPRQYVRLHVPTGRETLDTFTTDVLTVSDALRKINEWNRLGGVLWKYWIKLPWSTL